MLSLRSFQASSLRLPFLRRPASSSAIVGRTRSFSTAGSNNDDEKYLTGRVKFYDRKRLYGFITIDSDTTQRNNTPQEVFVQRRQIVSPNLTFDESPFNPFLVKGDRVRFKVRLDEENDNKPVATEVTSETGKPVPPLRDTYLRTKIKYLQAELGEYVHAIMKDKKSPPEEQWQRVQDAWKIIESKEQETHQLIERLGMRVDDFPLTPPPKEKREP